MAGLRRVMAALPLWALVLACATLGLAPMSPEPHVWEKLKMLAAGALTQPIDMVDLALHGLPWVLLVLKLFSMLTKRA
ncbi:RND transporter [Tropicibacter oceani]|uniref:RND transporter n=1 Tax=Tropicibacter oceani TaxID=3058420 RepID=A0ABY8QIM0_9RHOB|nr:RND transporter [Tropicibacter oceani]WGW03833.1 RND transporter [Tropicibacter oceani]